MSEDAVELRGVLLILTEPRHGFLQRHVHLLVVDDRLENLLLECRDAPVPEKRRAVNAVEDRRDAASADASEDAFGQGLVVGEVPLRVVARRASDRAVAGKLFLVEEPPAQLDFLSRERVVFRDRQVVVEPERDVEAFGGRQGGQSCGEHAGNEC